MTNPDAGARQRLVQQLEAWAHRIMNVTYPGEARACQAVLLREAIAALSEGEAPQGEPVAATELDAERVLQTACMDCGLPYRDFPLDTTLPDEQWRQIHDGDGGLLCASCIVKRGARLSGVIALRAKFEFANESGRPSLEPPEPVAPHSEYAWVEGLRASLGAAHGRANAAEARVQELERERDEIRSALGLMAGGIGLTLTQEVERVVRDLKARPAPEPETGWQPIATAPKGQRVLVVLKQQPGEHGGEITFAWFVMTEGAWAYDDGDPCVPTHWHPLPIPSTGGDS